MELVFTEKEEDSLTSIILDIGETMLKSGAEVNRVEDTIRRIGLAYGFVKVDIFTIMNLMILSVHTPEERVITQTRRITSSTTNLEKVARANALSRNVCQNPISVEELKKASDDIINNTKEYGFPVKMFAYLISATSFTVFFGGSVFDALVSALSSLLVCVIVTLAGKLRIQPIISTLVTSLLMTSFISGLLALGIGDSFDTIVMGNIMLLIPGIYLTSSIRDIITGDTVSGLMGVCDALLKSFAIAIGCVAIMLLTGIV